MFDALKNKYNYAKENMNEIRFKLQYVILPIFICLNSLIFLSCLLVLFLGKFVVVLVSILLVLSLALTIGLIVYVKYVKKQEVLIEAEKLKVFFTSNLMMSPECSYILPKSDDEFVDLTFSETGIKIGELGYSYNAFNVGLFTSNFMNQVNLVLMFSRNEQGDMEDGDENGVTRFTLPLNLNLLSILNKFNIDIKNPDVLKFIKDNPEESAKQILKYGKIQNDYKEIEKKIKLNKQSEQPER